MIQDIEPHVFCNEFRDEAPDNDDYILYFNEDKVLMGFERFPQMKHFMKNYPHIGRHLNYLFSVDEKHFYLVRDLIIEEAGEWRMQNVNRFRDCQPGWLAFAGITGSQLYRFYQSRRFCGACASAMKKSMKERALICENCGLIEYPKLSPAVIVAVTDGNRLLMSCYARSAYTKYALLAGFAEVGETLEQTVHREVFEEVGLHVKNLRYYKSQPWSFTDSLLVGFFVELDGSDRITLDEEELAEARWFRREDIPASSSDISLTNEMIEQFRENLFSFDRL